MEKFNQNYTVSNRFKSESGTEAGSCFLQVKQNAIRILILDGQGDNILAFDEIQFTRNLAIEDQVAQFQHFLPQSCLSQLKVEKVMLVFEPIHFALVPNPVWNPEKALHYLLQTSDPEYDFQLLVHPGLFDAHLVFALPKAWADWANQLFASSEMEWQCNLATCLETCEHLSHETSDFQWIWIENQYAFFISFRNGQLQFCNRFTFKTENDLLYFSLLAAQSAGLEPENARVIIAGSLLSSSLGFEKLNRYFGQLEFFSQKPSQHPSESPLHQYPSIFCDLICHLKNPVSA